MDMVRQVMQLKMVTGIRRYRHRVVPIALGAAEFVPRENNNSDIIRYLPVMRGELAQRFQHVCAHRQIRSARLLGSHHPAIFRAKLPDPSRPFFRIVRDVA